MWTKHFWLSTLERMVKTFAQSLAAILVADGGGLLDIGWPAALSTAGMAAVISVLMSMGSSAVGPDGSPSLVGESPKEPFADPPGGVWVHGGSAPSGDEPADPEDETASGRHVLDDDPDDVPVQHYLTQNEAARRADRKI